MPSAVFKDLCLDANRPDVVGPFWQELLGLTPERQRGGDWVLRGPRPEQTIWINSVPEPSTVKSRVHLDVRTATYLGPERWNVREDPDGLVWCAFAPEPYVGAYELCVDCADAELVARWWAAQFGVEAQHEDGKSWWWLECLDAFPYEYWVFNPVPEPKTAKNRMHWDVTASVDVLVAAGATVLARHPSWTGMADPEGNEFCAFPPADKAVAGSD